MDLVLLCADEGAFVDVRMNFYVGIVAELEGIPFAVIDNHCGRHCALLYDKYVVVGFEALTVVEGGCTCGNVRTTSAMWSLHARVLEHLPSPYFTLSDFHIAPARTDCCTNMIDRVTGILLR